MSKVIFSTKEMEKFLTEFNVPFMKYFGINELPDNLKNIEKYMDDITAGDFYGSKCSASELADVFEIVSKVYGDEEEAKNDVKLYQIVVEKFIREFVGIEGLDTLYKPLFFVFEWLMHLEYKVERNSYSYYRDHFIHQVRNMTEMLMLLTNEEFELKEQCIEALKKGNSRLAVQMRKAVEETKKNPAGFDAIGDFASKIAINKEKEKNIGEDYVEEAIYTYILLACTVVTSVIHDIGYPLEFINGNLTRMGNFLPASHFFFEKKNSTLEIHRILQDSLLYQTISPSKIAEKINAGDHGAISACVLLMKYYENGKIFSMPPIQKIIIELSALTIFEHTLKYELLGTGSDKYQISFEENPFSFLFRLCDDIEEWDRTYFEITNQSNFLVCPKCKSIINRWEIGTKERTYACGCGAKGINHNIFKYRKLTSVDTCERVEFEVYKKNNQIAAYQINIDYGLIGLLQASAYSVTFAGKRAEALREIKKMTFSQSGTKPMYICSFISNNPVMIKSELLRRYLENYSGKWVDTILAEISLSDSVENNLSLIWSDNVYEDLLKWIPLKKQSKLYKVQIENMLLYMKLIVLGKLLYCIKRDDKTDGRLIKEYFRKIQEKTQVLAKSLAVLVEDCLMQQIYAVSREEYLDKKWTYKEQYYNMFVPSKELNLAVENYIYGPLYDYVRIRAVGNIKQKQELKKRGIEEIHCHYDFYSDYGVFQEMYEQLK